jgi:hypothetical protein
MTLEVLFSLNLQLDPGSERVLQAKTADTD